MANLRQDPRTENWLLQFRYQSGSKFTKSTGTKDRRKAEDKRREVEQTIQLLRDGLITIPETADVAEWIFTRGRSSSKRAPEPPKVSTISHVADAWLHIRELEATAGQISASSYASDFARIKKFKEFCKHAPATELGQMLVEYRQACLRRLAAGAAGQTIKHELRTVKAMTTWAWDSAHIDTLPRCLRGYAKIQLPQPDPRAFTQEEVQRLCENASGRTKLFILLAINCGYTQSDISSLTHDMIQWDVGIIDRSRSKTKQPQVHKLWPSTLRLLREHVTDGSGSDLCFVGQKGNPLLHEFIRENGKPYRVDSIRLAFDRTKKVCKLQDGRGFKTLRKTGATEIEKANQERPWVSSLYLGHSEKSAKKHYTPQFYDVLHQETDKLGKLFEVFE